MPAIRVHHTETNDGAWDGAANEARLSLDQDRGFYSSMYAWYDPEGDESAKGTYKFPHHFVGQDGSPGAASIRACQAVIASLNGGRGGADIPDADRRGVWSHVAAHLEDADVEPADLRSLPWDWAVEQERRTVRVPELRVLEVDGVMTAIEGYAAVFGQWSENLGGFVERVRAGAFSKTLADGADVRALWQHNPEQVLGRTKNGTLTLGEDDFGLRYHAVPPDTQWGHDALVSVARGDVDQSSFGFETVRDVWKSREDGEVWERELIELKLYDVSPVTFPAYPQTSAQTRAKLSQLRGAGASSLPFAPGQGPHPEDNGGDDGAGARARLARMRRRLDLIDRA